METEVKKPKRKKLKSYNFFLFNDEFDSISCGKASKFIFERNLMNPKPNFMELIINSPGGAVDDCFSVIDAINGSSVPVRTHGFGLVASCGLLLLMAGEPGQRTVSKNSTILSHQFSSYFSGKEFEHKADQKLMGIISKRIMLHYKKCTGLDEETIRKFLLPPEDVWLTPKEAVKYGLADKISDSIN